METYKALYAKRERIIESFEDDVITNEQRDEKLSKVGHDTRVIHEKLTESNPTPSWTPTQLVELFRPFTAWADLGREAKRRVLNGLAMRFHIADYEINGIHLDKVGVNPNFDGNYSFLCNQISTTS